MDISEEYQKEIKVRERVAQVVHDFTTLVNEWGNGKAFKKMLQDDGSSTAVRKQDQKNRDIEHTRTWQVRAAEVHPGEPPFGTSGPR